MVVSLNSGISAVFGDKIVSCVGNTEDIQYKFYIYLNVTNKISSSLHHRLQVNDTRFNFFYPCLLFIIYV